MPLFGCKSKSGIAAKFQTMINSDDEAPGPTTGKGNKVKKGVLKRPSGAIGVLKKPASASGDGGDSGGGDSNAATHRNKHLFYLRQKEKLPVSLRGLAENSTRGDLHDIIDKLVIRDKNGKWSLDVKNPELHERVSIYKDSFKEDVEVIKPLGIATGLFGGKQALDDALEQGDARMITQKNGKVAIGWQETKMGTRGGSKNTLDTSGSKKLTNKEYAAFTDLAASFNFSFQLSGTEIEALDNADAPEDFPEKAKAKIKKANDVLKKVVKQSMPYFQNVQKLKTGAAVMKIKSELMKSINAHLMILNKCRAPLPKRCYVSWCF